MYCIVNLCSSWTLFSFAKRFGSKAAPCSSGQPTLTGKGAQTQSTMLFNASIPKRASVSSLERPMPPPLVPVRGSSASCAVIVGRQNIESCKCIAGVALWLYICVNIYIYISLYCYLFCKSLSFSRIYIYICVCSFF